MSGRTSSRVIGDRPLVTAVSKTAGLNAVAWRGTAGADGYRVQRSVLGGGWKTVSGPMPVSANDAPWLDRATVPASSRYRVQAVDAAGTGRGDLGSRRRRPEHRRPPRPAGGLVRDRRSQREPAPDPDPHGVEVAPAPGRTGWVSYAADGLVRAELDARPATAGRGPRCR